jgi:hypothetical protein
MFISVVKLPPKYRCESYYILIVGSEENAVIIDVL